MTVPVWLILIVCAYITFGGVAGVIEKRLSARRSRQVKKLRDDLEKERSDQRKA